MAIKGKKKARGGGAPRTVAPRPRVERRRPPLVRRTWFRRTFAAASALLVLFVGLTVLGRVHRAGALRDYERTLTVAQRPFQTSTESGNANGLTAVVAAFAANGPSKPLRDHAKTWEENFRKAADNVRALRVPEQLRAANEEIALAMDDYTGMARIYAVAAGERDLQNQATDAALKKKIGDHITLLLSHITEIKIRADALIASARRQIDDLKRAWGLEVRVPAQSQPSGPPIIPS